MVCGTRAVVHMQSRCRQCGGSPVHGARDGCKDVSQIHAGGVRLADLTYDFIK